MKILIQKCLRSGNIEFFVKNLLLLPVSSYLPTMHAMLKCLAHHVLVFPINTVFFLNRLWISVVHSFLLRYNFIEGKFLLMQLLMQSVINAFQLAVQIIALYILIETLVTDRC